jgi:FkbH-like protein
MQAAWRSGCRHRAYLGRSSLSSGTVRFTAPSRGGKLQLMNAPQAIREHSSLPSFSPDLYWHPLPSHDWRPRLAALAKSKATEGAWDEAVALANHRLNFQLTNALAAVTVQLFKKPPADFLQTKPERLAILSSSTTAHLHPSLRVGALRRGLWLDTYENEYGQYRQELLDKNSALGDFSPTTVLFCLDAAHLSRGIQDCRTRDQASRFVEDFVTNLGELWRIARDRFDCHVLQQTIVPCLPPLFGENEHRYPASAAAFVAAANARLRELSDVAQGELVAVDARIAQDGLAAWHNPALWLKSKQEIALGAAPMYGDLVGRVIAAKQGRVAKCCVLDLDNTLWGGVVGDDGVDGIVVGQGSTLGEAFVAMQTHALELRRRGVILAVCSKNDDQVARRPFATHPDMVLKESHFGCFIANWDDKAANIRTIARHLNIGLDTLVFVDDNPFERSLVRRELPMVSVPELPDDPVLYPRCLADAGYFEGVTLTDEDFARADYYGPERRPTGEGASETDLAGYLTGLEMNLVWGPVDPVSLARTVQLINKTNQFNLTTKRYTEQEVRALMADPSAVCLQLRLLDRFGDNGIIAVVIGHLTDGLVLELDTWLMSCRVLGRQVEEATLNVVAEVARRLGARKLLGIYRPTQKNGMVSGHYKRLGFSRLTEDVGGTVSILDLETYEPHETSIRTSELAA